MNTTTLMPRLTAIALSAILTLGMLMAVNGLATGDAPDALLARIAATARA